LNRDFERKYIKEDVRKEARRHAAKRYNGIAANATTAYEWAAGYCVGPLDDFSAPIPSGMHCFLTKKT